MEIQERRSTINFSAMKQNLSEKTMKLINKLILAAFFFMIAGCSSKLERQLLRCADFDASQITIATAMKRLGLTAQHTNVMSEIEIVNEYCDTLD